jgi:hypothetical protein
MTDQRTSSILDGTDNAAGILLTSRGARETKNENDYGENYRAALCQTRYRDPP